MSKRTKAPEFQNIRVGDMVSWLQWDGNYEHVYRTYGLVIGESVKSTAYTTEHVPIFVLCPRLRSHGCDTFDSNVFREWRVDQAKDLFVIRSGEKLGWYEDED